MKNSLLTAFAVALIASSCSFTRPFAVTNNAVGTKVGKSTTATMFSSGVYYGRNPYAKITGDGLLFNSNYGIAEAAKNGGISKVATVDVKYSNYILFGKFQIIVTGE